MLAAGYATRLYPRTLTQPKPLLPIAGRPILDYLLDRLEEVEKIDEAYVVTNAKFAGQFEQWAAARGGRPSPLRVSVVNDGTTGEESKLGAIGDIEFALRAEEVDDDLIVVAGDNLFTDSVRGFAEFGAGKDAPVVAVYDVGSVDEAKKFSVFRLASDGHITDFEEKPKQPSSTRIGIALYYFPKHSLRFIRQYMGEGNRPDPSGRLIEWLFSRVCMYTWAVPGKWFDIGSPETLAEADAAFLKIQEKGIYD